MINIPNNIRQLCEKDTCRKNFRIHFVNGEHDDLTNENIVTESVSLTESICSGEFQFGMCESSTLEVDCYLEKNVKGAEIIAQIEIDISDESAAFIEEYGQTSDDVDFPFYPILYGDFIVKDCKKSKNGIRHISAYTQLIGEERVTSSGTMSYLDYGMSELEITKMRFGFARNTNYDVDLNKFIRMNIQNFKRPNDEQMTTVPYTDVFANPVGNVIENLVVDGVPEPNVFAEFTIYEADAYRTSTADSSLYYLDGETESLDVEKWLDECLREAYGDNISYSIRKDVDLSIVQKVYLEVGAYDFAFVGGNKYVYFYPYASAVQIPKLLRFIIRKNVFPPQDEFVFDHVCEKVPVLKRVDTSSWAEKMISLPRTKNEFGQYVVDYYSLFGDGLEVTTKDKKGNVRTVTYKFSIRDIIEGYAELNALLGAYWRRDGAFSFVELVTPVVKRLDSYRVGSSLTHSSDYMFSNSLLEEIEYDDEFTKPYGKVVCTCVPLDGTSEITLTVDVFDTSKLSEDDYLVYDLSSNYIIKAFPDGTSTIRSMMQNIANALEEMRYMPCELVARGLPFVECGDWVEFAAKDGAMFTNVLKQTIRGVQNLMTSIESEG